MSVDTDDDGLLSVYFYCGVLIHPILSHCVIITTISPYPFLNHQLTSIIPSSNLSPPPTLSPFSSEPAEGYGVSSVPGDGISRAFLNRVLSVWMPPALTKPSSTVMSPATLGADPRYNITCTLPPPPPSPTHTYI